ncbi:hypothetical protein P3S68_030748 [Capsicum galapagoense]
MIIDDVRSFPAKISVRSRMATYREFKQILVDQELKKRFKWSCFGHLRNLPEHLKFNGKLVHYLLLRRIKNDKIHHEMCSFEKYPWGKETFQLIMDYLKNKSNLKKQKEVFDEKQKASYALFGFLWAFMVFPHLGEFARKLMNEPLPIPRIFRWHTSKSDKIIEGDPFKYKGKVTENVHPYIIPTIRETKMDYMITFELYTDEVKNNILDGLKKKLEGVTVLTSNKDSDDDGDLGGNPVGVCVGDDDSPSTSKYAVETSSPGDLHKRVAALEEAVMDIAAYIKEKRMKKKENDERQYERVHVHESESNEEGEKKSKMDELAVVVAEEEKEEEKKDGEEDKNPEEGGKVAAAAEEEEAAADEQGGAEKGKTVEKEVDKEEVEQEPAGERKEEAEEETTAEAEEETTTSCEVRKEGMEENETEEAAADAHAEKEGEEGVNEEATVIVEKKEVEVVQTDVVMDIVDEINSNTCVMRNLGKETFKC